MPGILQLAFGGMLAGAGEGLAQSGADDRAIAMKVLDQQNAKDLLATQYGYRMQENTQQEGFRQADLATEGNNQLANTALAGKNSLATVAAEGKNQLGVEGQRESFEGGQIKNLETDGTGAIVGITGSGQVKNTGVTSGALSKADQDALDLIKQANTSKEVIEDPDNPGSKKTVEKVNVQGVATALAASGRPGLQNLANTLAPQPIAMAGGGQPTGGTLDLSQAGADAPTIDAAPSTGAASTTGASPTSSKGPPIPVPPAYLSKPDGTVLQKGSQSYVKQGTQLVPQ